MRILASMLIRNSLGMIRRKNDKLDAERIAMYLYKSRECLSLWQSRRPVINELAMLESVRSKLDVFRMTIQRDTKEVRGFVEATIVDLPRLICQRSLEELIADLADINIKIWQLYLSDPRLRELIGWITSVPGIGERTAINILVKTNEFINIRDPRKFACYAGIAPFPHESGKSLLRRARVS